jgi:GNAT superfamily N-acetyltransferase
MIEIVSSESDSENTEIYYRWITEEWGAIQSPQGSKIHVPKPLLALDENKLRGGLSFLDSKHPVNDEMVLWINTVFVEPTSRGLGIGSMLINHAEEVLKLMGGSDLFAFTNIPELYQNLGWGVLKRDQQDYVLSKSI